MISMPLWNGLTWFLCGGVDGQRLWPGASRIESRHREVVHRVRSQSCDVNHRVVSRNTHFANGVRLGVVLPVHNLGGRVKTVSPLGAILTQVGVPFTALLQLRSRREFRSLFELQAGAERELMHIIFSHKAA